MEQEKVTTLPFAECLRLVRKIQNWTQSDLAEEVGSHQPRVSVWESGKMAPKSGASKKFFELFFRPYGVKVTWPDA